MQPIVLTNMIKTSRGKIFNTQRRRKMSTFAVFPISAANRKRGKREREATAPCRGRQTSDNLVHHKKNCFLLRGETFPEHKERWRHSSPTWHMAQSPSSPAIRAQSLSLTAASGSSDALAVAKIHIPNLQLRNRVRRQEPRCKQTNNNTHADRVTWSRRLPLSSALRLLTPDQILKIFTVSKGVH